jgi:hypothetical protein
MVEQEDELCHADEELPYLFFFTYSVYLPTDSVTWFTVPNVYWPYIPVSYGKLHNWTHDDVAAAADHLSMSGKVASSSLID